MTTNDIEAARPLRKVSPPKDPRQPDDLPERDETFLLHVAILGWLAQYAGHVLDFFGTSETVVSRSVKRLWNRGLIRIERFRGRGINLLHLTEAGRRYLIDRGLATDADIFVWRRRFDPRQLSHHLSVVDCYVAFRRLIPKAILRPSWVIQRRFATADVPERAKLPIPDLYVSTTKGGVVCVEVDRATEGLNLFEAKLVRLSECAEIWCDARQRAVVVLTIGQRRIESLKTRLNSKALSVPIVVLALPSDVGRPAITAMEELLKKLTKDVD